MKLDAEGRSQRARMAAQINAEKRRAATHTRDIGVVQAYGWLTRNGQSKDADLAGIQFLSQNGLGPNLPAGETVWSYLARATSLTKRRIHQIVIQAQKHRANLARFPHAASGQASLL